MLILVVLAMHESGALVERVGCSVSLTEALIQRCWLLELPVKHVLQYHHVENCMRVSTLQNILSMASSNAIGGAHACIIFEYACASGTGRLRSTMWLRKQSRLRQC